MFVADIPNAMANDDVQTIFKTQAVIGRFSSRRGRKLGKSCAKVLVPDNEVDGALSQNMHYNIAEDGEPGFKLRVERWDKKLAPPPRVQVSSTTREWKRRIPAACTTSVSNGLKERACFVAEFLAAQSRSIGGPQSPRGQQLYSRVVSNKTADTRLKFMETAIYDMRRLLERLIKTPS